MELALCNEGKIGKGRGVRRRLAERPHDDYRLHDNRHTHASHLVSSGLSLEIVGRLLGHTNPLTTKRYAHLSDEPLRAAAERFGSKMDALEKFPTS
jgi:integrase